MPASRSGPSSYARSLVLSAAALACAPAARGSSAVTSPPAAGGLGIDTSTAASCAPASAAFCWVNPLPQGSTLGGVWLAGAYDGWAVGPVGSILRWNGSTFIPVDLPSPAALRALWGSAADDVWAVGDAVLHFDGLRWSIASGVPAGAWNAVHGSSASDVWMAGAGGAVAHFDGQRWAPLPATGGEDLSAVAVVAPGEVYAASAHGGAVLRWDGSSWTMAARLAARSLFALLAAGPGDVWAAGEALEVNAAAGARGAALAHLAGGAWQTVVVPGLETTTFTALAGTPGGTLWAFGTSGSGSGQAARLDAGGWHVEPLPSPALPPRAASARGALVLAVGDGGAAFARSAGAWAALHHGTPGYLQAAATSPASDAWFATVLPDGGAQRQTELLHVVGGSAVVVPLGISDVVYGVWANAPDDVWAGTLQNGFIHFDGKRWIPGVGGYTGLVDGVWASGPNDVWGVAGSVALHFDGVSVTRHALPGGGARRVFGLAPGDLWAVGGAGVVHHWDGTAWSPLAIPGGPALGVWGAAGDDVWLVGEGGLALHWDGRALTRVETGTAATLWATSGSGRDDLWAVGAGGTVLHYDGRSFAPVPSGTRNALASVTVSASGEVYLGGEFGTILRKAR